MSPEKDPKSSAERLALLSLWAIPGIGPGALSALEAARGPLPSLLDVPPLEWAGAFGLAESVMTRLSRVKRLSQIGERVQERAHEFGMHIDFAEDPAFPAKLRDIPDAPPLLFRIGEPGHGKRRAALVGSRHPDGGFLPRAQRFARDVAAGGVCIVSGAAEGIDRVCHLGALDAGAETWAFVGSALDQLDAAQAILVPPVLAGGGSFYSELPPGVRASKQTFPRRNRLISGASDVIVILRAAMDSGCYHTAFAALRQRRTLLAMPGEADNEAAALCNTYIGLGLAGSCLTCEDVWAALHLDPEKSGKVQRKVDLNALSDDARVAYGVLPHALMDFEDVLSATQLPAARLTSALCELELEGLVVQHPGKQYERI